MKAKKKYTSGGKMTKESMMKYMTGGNVPKAQNGGTLAQVNAFGSKEKPFKEGTAVGRGKSGEDFKKKREEIMAEETAKILKGKPPGTKPTTFEQGRIIDNTRERLEELGYTERGVFRKDTSERLPSEKEEAFYRYKNRMK